MDKNILKYGEFLLEHKLWGKSIKEFLNWIESKSNKYWVWLDTETTGLRSDIYDVQLTQLSSIVTKYYLKLNSFSEIDIYDKKIKLKSHTLSDMSKHVRIKKVLSFNHYGKKGIEYNDEDETIKNFSEFILNYDEPIFVIQNAEFDMTYLNTRNSIVKFDNEVIDTKQILQLYYLPLLQKLSESDEYYKELILKIGTSDRESGLISSSLSKVGPAMGIDMSGYHDALTDCRLMMEMFQKMIQLLKENSEVDISKYQGERINVTRI